MGIWFLPAFARRLGLAEFDYVVLLPTEEECAERVRSRVDHGFSDEAAARSMHEQFAAHRPSSGQVIESGRLDGQATADEVLRRRAAGDLRARLADL